MDRTFGMAACIVAFALGSAPAAILPNGEEPGTFVVPLHPELIPKNVTIERCYYDLEVVAPGTTFAFDINGSGFDEAFYKIISVDPDALDVSVKNLRLVTANQIHGQIEVGPDATTQYIHPKVIIRSLPVFRAPDPFGVVRPGEVLDVQLTSIDETGQWGRFRVITNLNDRLYQRFRIEPTNPLLEVSNVKTQFPFYVDGVVMIAQGLKHGQYGLVTYLGKREIFRQDPLVDVVKPTVGKTGSIEKVEAVEKAHRPGDPLDLMIKGSAFLPNVVSSLVVRIDPTEMGPSSFTYVSQGRLDARLQIPLNAVPGVYGVSILSNGKVLQHQPNVFGIVPANWISTVKLSTPLSPGKSGTLALLGRDMSQDFARSIELSTDSEDLKVSKPRLQDPSTLTADLTVAAGLAPGDYIIHVAAGGKPLKLPRGNIIKITP